VLTKDKLSKVFQGKVAVFIDAANLEHSVADLGSFPPRLKRIPKGYVWRAYPKGYWKVDYKKLLKFFKSKTNFSEAIFYSARFNTKSHDNFLTFLKSVGFKLVTKEIKRIKTWEGEHRKANFDVEISVDATYKIGGFTTFVLFSGDSDFAYLISFLKKEGKKVVVISQRGHASNELITKADKYVDLFKLKDIFLVPKKQKSR
jgi:uncharacterized LabA/DUF88 family protein